ncbi:MAG: leucine--tRNA ligase, partial [Coprobacter sp.]|nr:leucine--tRNA ligase [Coprobacter sp.]
KVMRQWCLRVSAYAQRLLNGLDKIDWSDSLKETQRNWIGRSEGAEMQFKVANSDVVFTIFTTRADTIFGVTFMVLAPESEYVSQVVTEEQAEEVKQYLESIKHRTERERIADRKVSGVFTGAYAINPLNNNEIPIYISDYVLAGYGTGAIMAVPAHDSRDYAFAKTFNLPIIPLIEGCDVSEESFDAKEGKMMNSEGNGLNLNGLEVKEAIAKTKEFIKENNLGKVKINYRLRDAIFSRQRYWGEPFPVYYKEGMPYMLPDEKLPLQLPEIDKYLPTESGEPPLGRAKNWETAEHYPLELCTMPGFAGSSAYYLRYMDPHNPTALVSKEANEYWRNVDLYIGGTEHATGHLIYSRFWNKFLFDLGVVCEDEPFKKLVNQGMIQGRSNFVYRIKDTNTFVSLNLKGNYETTPIHVDVNIVSNDRLDIEAFRNWNPEYKNAEFILEDGEYVCGWAVEKMSKSMFNVVNPDDIVERYGADTLRLYEMFLGPLEQSKPWDTNGIDGVHRFIKKLWNLFYDKDTLAITDEEATADELKALHKLINKVGSDIENFSFNTSVSAFMICVNELTSLKCHKRAILKELVILLAPFTPHLCEELWSLLGFEPSVCDAPWPVYNAEFTKESTINYAISFNGKMRFNMSFPADAAKEEIEKAVLEAEQSAKWIDGKTPKKIIVVPNKLVNIVI